MKLTHDSLRGLSTKILASAYLIALSNMAYAAPVENFGENLAGLQQAFARGKVHILQVGDSHTAGDYFTEQLRKRLQADVGDGGIGFAYPMDVKGQRTARHGYQSNGWQLNNSRFSRDADYALGGVVASPSYASGYLKLTSRYYNGDRQNARIVVKGNTGQTIEVKNANGVQKIPLYRSGWQTVSTSLVFPSTIYADTNMSVGGFWLDRPTGGVVSAMGINGATQDYWQRWHGQLAQDLADSQADLVVLAYGTNEAYQNDVSGQVQALQQAIRQIRQGLPNASILLVNAPESLKSTSGSCGSRAINLDRVQSQIRQAAVNSGTLYWSWQDAMGGRCSMKQWIAQGLGRSDGVHFSRAGYERAANDLYDGLKVALGNPATTPQFSSSNSTSNATHTTIRRTYSSPGANATITNVVPSPQGIIKICKGENCTPK